MGNNVERKKVKKANPVDIETKLKIMKEYKEKTGEEIRVNTVYKGHNIGIWQLNLRSKYLHGKLNIKKDLKKKFIKAGILSERKRGKHTSDEEKFELLEKFHKENPDTTIKFTTIDSKGNPIGKYRSWLQTRINNEESNLTEEQLSKLKEYGYINLSRIEVAQICRKYNLSSSIVKEILKDYGDIDNFIKTYKAENIYKKFPLNRKGILLSSKQLTMKQKDKYLLMLEDAFGKNPLEDEGRFVIVEDIEDAISNLSEKDRYIISERYDLSFEKHQVYTEIAQKLGVSAERIKQINNRALNRLSNNIKIYVIDTEIKKRNKLELLYKNLKEMSLEDWQKEKINYDVKNLGLTELATKRLKENGYHKIKDLYDVPASELKKIRGFGEKLATKTTTTVTKLIKEWNQYKKEEEEMTLKRELENTVSLIDGYYKAKEHYINEEDIFNLEGNIPPTIIKTEKTILSKKKAEKNNKKAKLNGLEEEIELQKSVEEKILSALGQSPKENLEKK